MEKIAEVVGICCSVSIEISLEADKISSGNISKFSNLKVLNLFVASTVTTPLNVEIQDMAVTGLKCTKKFLKLILQDFFKKNGMFILEALYLLECCNNFKHVLVVTSHTRTVHPAALSANGNDNKTPVTGPECPVKVQIEVEDESEIFEKQQK